VGSSRNSTGGDGRRHHQTRGQVEAPAHAAGIGLHEPICGAGQLELLQQFDGPPPRADPAQSQQSAQQHQVLPPGQLLVHGRVLAGQADAAAHQLGLPDHVGPGDDGPAGVRPHQGGQDPHGRGLAGAVGPEHPEHGPGRHRQVDPAQRLVIAIALAQPFGFDRSVHQSALLRLDESSSSRRYATKGRARRWPARLAVRQ
jgi:hypothetical protein